MSSGWRRRNENASSKKTDKAIIDPFLFFTNPFLEFRKKIGEITIDDLKTKFN
jgi:hypothetical protein